MEQGKLAFDMLFQGPRAFFPAGNGKYSDWGTRTGMDEALISQPTGHLSAGEPVKVYLINRATGYMGSTIATYARNAGQLTFRP